MQVLFERYSRYPQPLDLKDLGRGVVSEEAVVLRRWGSSIQKFGFINGIEIDISKVSPSSERICLRIYTCSKSAKFPYIHCHLSCVCPQPI